jgi:hypothetical protein
MKMIRITETVSEIERSFCIKSVKLEFPRDYLKG